MIFDDLYQALGAAGASAWAEHLPSQIQQAMNSQRFGDLPRWQQALMHLPKLAANIIQLDQDCITINNHPPVSNEVRDSIHQGLKQLMPWRKGPYHIHGVDIDTEWRSDLKWQRLQPHLASLQNKWVLDIGCGSGYHGWRMLGAGAQRVIGIDPSPLFVMQFQALKHFIGAVPLHVLPLGIEHLPEKLQLFDTVFSMGVLYHRRSPLEHLQQCRDCLKSGGELVLETLVISGDDTSVLLPKDRYAKMRNVWFIPSAAATALWLQRAGFQNVRIVDETITTLAEQRRTEWMQYESLSDFLDSNNPALTIEGYPAPRRALLLATAP